MAAIDDLNELLAGLPNATLISTNMKNAALAGALIPDEDSVWPGSTDPVYVPTYDVYYAALTLLGWLRAQPVVRQTSSEGTSIAVDKPDWSAISTYYQSMSVIFQATSSGVLNKVLIPDGPHVRRTNMNVPGVKYGDVDTDVG